MAIDEVLTQRVRDVLYPLSAVEEKKMFGGVAFMVNGNMTVGVQNDNLIARVGLEKYQVSLSKPGADLFQPTGKPMAGWVVIMPEGYRADDDIEYWVKLALDFVRTLPSI